jgi:hypothetical protein
MRNLIEADLIKRISLQIYWYYNCKEIYTKFSSTLIYRRIGFHFHLPSKPQEKVI